ncbi:hypothetical protein SLEP1_g6993 [Rubroshorea leprosula]|uniref:Uncharacterized protein n=1 Tax=Rubroshorea leprosula TaxID=152421 RepID=A0AAV5HWY5_9ROSI|nr:hypothetical protein SLEP1_g6993 [Rubroshorea leprosula]
METGNGAGWGAGLEQPNKCHGARNNVGGVGGDGDWKQSWSESRHNGGPEPKVMEFGEVELEKKKVERVK